MSNVSELGLYAAEQFIVGSHTVELIRPSADSVCIDQETILPQPPGQAETLYIANEQGPCGGVEMAEVVMDDLIKFRDEHEAKTGDRVSIFANHPPSKGADRALLYQQAGVKFGVPIQEIPKNSIYVFSAHGADPVEVEKAEAAGLHVVDTTCPLVGHIYQQIKKIVEKSSSTDIAAHEVGVVYLSGADMNHPEVKGTQGVARKAGVRFIPVTSMEEVLALANDEKEVGPAVTSLSGLRRVMVTGLTTNNADVTKATAKAFEERLRERDVPTGLLQPYNERSVCNTVKFRQNAIRQMVRDSVVESIVVVGALGSNNTNQLVGAVIDEASKMPQEGFTLKRVIFANTHRDVPEITGVVGVVSGASTQQRNIDQIVDKLNVPHERIIKLGQTDKNGMFRPMGGQNALARRVLDSDFRWFEAED